MKFLARFKSRGKRRGKLFRYGWKISLLLLIAGGGLALLLFYGAWAASFDMKKVGAMPERNTVFDVDGRIYSRLAGSNRLRVSLDEVSPYFIDALLAREDTRFYQHPGVDWRGILRALVRDILTRSAKEGASSITQQLARNSLPLGGRTLSRKLLEAMVAFRIEHEFTKKQILELYVNRIYFGAGCYGVETASQAYFGKHAKDLSLPEAALIAGLIRSPNRFSPLKNPEGAAIERNAVLDRMVEVKKIPAAEANQAKQAKVYAHPKRLLQIQENYAMDAVQRDLNLILTQDQIDNGGMFIYTTLDPKVQDAAQQALETQLTKIEHQGNFNHPLKANYHPPENGEDSSMPYLEGAVVAIDNNSGGIRALVGGRDYAQSKFNRALPPANRQVGSAFKPFVYTVAFSEGMLPGAAISDAEIQPGEIDGAGTWSPANSDGTYGGIQPVSYGLIHSRNTMSVRVGQFAGLDSVQKIATTLNLSENVPHGPAIYIGSFETNLKDLTAAYTVFANGGVRKQAYIIERIDDAEHQPIYRASHLAAPALDPSAAWMTSQLMEEVLTRGTAAAARSLGFKLPAAGKTGTTNDYKDAWFVGYTSNMTCGVWVGFDQPVTIIPHGYGAALALPVWVQVMNKAATIYPPQDLLPAMPIQHALVCSLSNHLATTGCEAAGTAYELDIPADKVPTAPCEIHGGDQMQFAQKVNPFGKKASDFPNKLFNSFRKFFSGKP
ncbi:MAG TPA: PBP1A family penicillin-binding protein [Chthoniobacterales bacterium]|jgi:penicillin-binding protein, 1A family|nr:PBP1A family penicillin-binding protein [Chthoniobacterales bacterium]